MQLNENEIRKIISALRESNHCFQEPYYEVIYHDKYDNTETRIMEPLCSREYEDLLGRKIREDHYELRFRRIVSDEE